MYQNLVKTYASIGESDDVYIKAAQKLNNGISSDELAKRITITPVTNTQLLTVTATGGSAKEALDSVTAVTDSFMEVSNTVYPAGDIRTVNKGKLPKAPAKPNKKLNIAIGFFLGLMISVGLAFAMDYMDNTVESIEDIKRNFDLPIIGTIPLEQEN
ncbi:YveK family protein [Clostridium pasteurianum]|nr:GNVR domain-containing protein [Clostridium pasteurianum]